MPGGHGGKEVSGKPRFGVARGRGHGLQFGLGHEREVPRLDNAAPPAIGAKGRELVRRAFRHARGKVLFQQAQRVHLTGIEPRRAVRPHPVFIDQLVAGHIALRIEEEEQAEKFDVKIAHGNVGRRCQHLPDEPGGEELVPENGRRIALCDEGREDVASGQPLGKRLCPGQGLP